MLKAQASDSILSLQILSQTDLAVQKNILIIMKALEDIWVTAENATNIMRISEIYLDMTFALISWLYFNFTNLPVPCVD